MEAIFGFLYICVEKRKIIIGYLELIHEKRRMVGLHDLDTNFFDTLLFLSVFCHPNSGT